MQLQVSQPLPQSVQQLPPSPQSQLQPSQPLPHPVQQLPPSPQSPQLQLQPSQPLPHPLQQSPQALPQLSQPSPHLVQQFPQYPQAPSQSLEHESQPSEHQSPHWQSHLQSLRQPSRFSPLQESTYCLAQQTWQVQHRTMNPHSPPQKPRPGFQPLVGGS